MTTKKLTSKKLDKEIEAFFYTHGNRRQFGIFDLAKITAEGRHAYQATGDLAMVESAVKAACDKYEVKKEVAS